MSINLHEIESARIQIADVARAMLNGERSYIDGSRLICGYLIKARLDRFEPPFVTFVAIESETDTVPADEVRDRWSDAALSKLAQEWGDAEHYAKTLGEPASREAIDWLAAHPFRTD